MHTLKPIAYLVSLLGVAASSAVNVHASGGSVSAPAAAGEMHSARLVVGAITPAARQEATPLLRAEEGFDPQAMTWPEAELLALADWPLDPAATPRAPSQEAAQNPSCTVGACDHHPLPEGVTAVALPVAMETLPPLRADSSLPVENAALAAMGHDAHNSHGSGEDLSRSMAEKESHDLRLQAVSEDDGPFDDTVAALDDSGLDQVRGGFMFDTGLVVNFGIERVVFVNGELLATTSLNIAGLNVQQTVTPSTSNAAVLAGLPAASVILADGTPASLQASGAGGSPGASTPPTGSSAPVAPGTPPPVVSSGPAVSTPPAAPTAPVASTPVSSGSATPPVTTSTPAVSSSPSTPSAPAVPVVTTTPATTSGATTGSSAASSPPVTAPNTPSSPLAVIQIGPRNTASTAGIPAASVGTIIQNTLNNQKIGTLTTINATVNSAQLLRATDLRTSIRDAVTQAMRR